VEVAFKLLQLIFTVALVFLSVLLEMTMEAEALLLFLVVQLAVYKLLSTAAALTTDKQLQQKLAMQQSLANASSYHILNILAMLYCRAHVLNFVKINKPSIYESNFKPNDLSHHSRGIAAVGLLASSRITGSVCASRG